MYHNVLYVSERVMYHNVLYVSERLLCIITFRMYQSVCYVS